MLRRSVTAAGRRVSLAHGATRTPPCAPHLAPASAASWGCLASSLSASSRPFSQLPAPKPADTPKKPRKTRINRPKKATKAAEDAKRADEDVALQSNFLDQLEAAPDNVNVALNVFAAIQSATLSGMSKDVALALVRTFTKEKQLDKAMQVLTLCGKRKIDLLVAPYEQLMACCNKADDFDATLKVFELVVGVKSVLSTAIYTTALEAAHKSQKSELVPQILGQMLKDRTPHEARALQAALSAAAKSRQHELVLQLMGCSETLGVELTSEHYHLVLKSYASVGDMEAALGTRSTLQKNGFDLTEEGMASLVRCASKADDWDLVQGLLTGEEVVTTVSAFKAAIAAYGNKDSWDRVVDVYELMPNTLRSELNGWHLGAVIMGHAKAEDKELKLRALEMFKEHKGQANKYACASAITALLETDQFDAAMALVGEMKGTDITEFKSAYRAVALALIRRGTAETAEEAVQLLELSVQRKGNDPDTYLDIIQFYTSGANSTDANPSNYR